MQLRKEDLEGTLYSWSDEAEKTVFTGKPTRRSFDKFNGDQLLFLINFYGENSLRFTVEEARFTEKMILYYLPAEYKSEISVFQWLQSREYRMLKESLVAAPGASATPQ